MKLFKNILMTLIVCLIWSCQNTVNAPRKSDDASAASDSELSSSKLDKLNCQENLADLNFSDLQGETLNLCQMFDETSADMFMIQFVSSNCSECLNSIENMLVELDTNKDLKIIQVVMGDTSLSQEYLKDLADQSAQANIWLRDSRQTLDQIDPTVDLFDSTHYLLLTRDKSKLVVGEQNLEQITTIADESLGLSIDYDGFDSFVWDGKHNLSHTNWEISSRSASQ